MPGGEDAVSACVAQRPSTTRPSPEGRPASAGRVPHQRRSWAAQQLPPASTLKNAAMSASVPTSPSPLKSAEFVQGAAGQVPDRHAKKALMSASVPMSPSQLKSAEPQRSPEMGPA